MNELLHKAEIRRACGLICKSICTLALMLAAHGASALEPATPLANYGRQTWVMENGLPQNTVQALAQTKDGFLWIGTEAGLARFDGMSFTVFENNAANAAAGQGLPGNDIRCLLADADGALWIGTSTGLARWDGGAMRTFTTTDGLPGNNIRALQAAGDEGVQVSTENGDVVIRRGQIVPVQFDMLTSIDPAQKVLFTAKLADGAHAQATVSTVTVTERGRQFEWSVRRELPGSRVQALFADHEGGLWIGTNGGLARAVGDRVQTLSATDVLARASVLAVMEDREGNLWVGTESDGLHILRDQRFRVFDTREGLTSDNTTAVVEDAAGTLWVGTAQDGLNALKESGNGVSLARSYSVANGLASDVILSLAGAANGDLWVGTPDGLSRIHGGSVTTFTSADGLPDDFIRSLLVDADGSLWIGTRRGLVHWANAGAAAGKMEILTQARGLGSDLVGAMTRDAHGDLWVATLAGLSRLHGGAITNYTTANGLTSNIVTALLAQPDGSLLIGTQDHGWNVWDGQRFSAASGRGADSTVRAILQDGLGYLWFATADGITRCAGSGADCVAFGPADGLRSREMATNSHPSAWRSKPAFGNGEGLLWFTTPRGLVEVDPAHFHVNAVAPPVALERFVVDDIAQPLLGGDTRMRVKAGHVHFEFDYAGLSFVAPQKVRYRYTLEGFDHGWTEAGGRRAAYYTNIPPGKYTFRVEASNNDGVWSKEGAALAFELRPRFYQTIWFYVLLSALLAALVILVIRQRLRRAESEFQAVLRERSRIAREIHDTLAQGYVGISVQLELIAKLLGMHKTEVAQKQLDVTREYVREGLADARQSIWALRTQDAGETTLPVRLRRVVEAADGDGLAAKFSVYGAFRALPADTEQELMRVAQEAIHNVKKHAAASEMHVRLDYEPEQIILQVEDNGRGGVIDIQAGPAAGHFGLTGMRERAAAIGGTLEVKSKRGEGTRVKLAAPAPETAKELR